MALAIASPMPKKKAAAATSTIEAVSAAAATGATGASVLSSSAYNDFQISTGVAGTAEAKANALFADLPTDLSTVTADDLAIVKGVHDAAEDAETDAFDPAVDAADGDAADALQVGKIQNKVLKLTAEVLGIQIEAAQGGDDSDLAAEQTKLTTNIATDVASAGDASTAVDFDATS